MVQISKFAMPDGSPVPVGTMDAEAEGMGATQSVPSEYSSFEESALKHKVTVASPKAENNFDL